MDPGYFLMFLFMVVEMLLVTLLVLPMPSNEWRRFITQKIGSLWEYKYVHYAATVLLVLDFLYFIFVWDALLHPLYDFGILRSPIDMGVSCEVKSTLFREERNAFITGMGLFFFFVLNRLVDIQDKLHESRRIAKQQLSTRKTNNNMNDQQQQQQQQQQEKQQQEVKGDASSHKKVE